MRRLEVKRGQRVRLADTGELARVDLVALTSVRLVVEHDGRTVIVGFREIREERAL